MGLRDLLKKKDELDESAGVLDPEVVDRLRTPQFTFIRSDTHTEEIIHPPADPAQGFFGEPSTGAGTGGDDDDNYLTARDNNSSSKVRRSLDIFKSRSRSGSTSSRNSIAGGEGADPAYRRLSQRLRLSRSPSSSENVPLDLPEIVTTAADTGPNADKDRTEQQWERRATILAATNEKQRSHPATSPAREDGFRPSQAERDASPARGAVSSKEIDADIQEAIRLHEDGQLEKSTYIFGQLADPNGANNPLSQVLYGLALRHGWGCTPDPAAAVTYLSAAASNAATVENLALQAGLKKGGAAKGELVLAIFELANCFRHGWGIPQDAIAAKQYYETAANLGDTDAMNEVAWCYLEGFGCKKDKFAASKYYRLAEQNGNKTLGNTWIWKEKYNPENQKKKK